MSDKLVADLREESRLSQRTAWERADGGQDYCIAAQLADAAADRIEMQAARIAELEAAIKPFADAAESWLPEEPGDKTAGARLEHPHYGLERHASFTFGDLFAARAVLAASRPADPDGNADSRQRGDG